MRYFIDSGIIQVFIITIGIVGLGTQVKSCETERRKAKLECIKVLSVDECNRLVN